jgi:hypothetical protein
LRPVIPAVSASHSAGFCRYISTRVGIPN